MTRKPFEFSQLATLAEVILINRFKTSFKVSFHRDMRLYADIIKIMFVNDNGQWVELKEEYDAHNQDAPILSDEILAKIALMR